MPIVIPSREEIVDYEDVRATAALVINTLDQTILEFTTKNAKDPWLCFLGQAWDAGLDTFLNWFLQANGAILYPYTPSPVQIAPPEQPNLELTPWVKLPQQSTIRMAANVGGAAGNGNATGRIKIYYTLPKGDIYG